MLAYLNHIILPDANVWLQKGFLTAVKPAAILRQLRVPHLVEQELSRLQNPKKVGSIAVAALKFIKEHNVPVLPPSSVSHIADQEFIMYCMENAGKPLAVVTNDTGLQKDLAALCPDLLVLDWHKGACTLRRAPEYAGKVETYRDVIASAAVAGRADFPLRAKLLLEAGIEKLLVSPALPDDHANAKRLRGIQGVKPMPGLGEAGESRALLARLLVHEGKQRALLLLAEGEDALPYMGHRDTKLKSVDNTGFDVAVMDARGDITVLEPKGEPLPCKKQQTAAPKPKASTTTAAKAKPKATPATKTKAAPAAKTAPADDYPCCQKIRQALQRQELEKATQHIIEGLKMSLNNGRFVHVTKLLDVAKQHTLEISDDIVEVYICTILPRIETSKGMNQVMSRFTGKAGKKVLRRLIDQAHGTKAAETIVPKLEEWKNRSGMTDAQRKAIDAIIQYANEKK